MELNKLASSISWLIVASKEKIKFLNQEMKQIYIDSYLKNDKLLLKAQYHLNLAKVLLNQVEKNYIVFVKQGVNNINLLTRIKNIYLQRCLFQLSMSFDYFKENKLKIENVSFSLSKSLFNKYLQTIAILNNLLKDMDILISKF